MIISRLTTKAQTTIPQAVRVALGVGVGDELVYIIEDNKVTLAKAPTRPRPALRVDDPFQSFSEWDSEADRRAYADL